MLTMVLNVVDLSEESHIRGMVFGQAPVFNSQAHDSKHWCCPWTCQHVNALFFFVWRRWRTGRLGGGLVLEASCGARLEGIILSIPSWCESGFAF